MKKFIALSILVCSLAIVALSQNPPERRVIEVSGSAEQMVVPDEFTFKITLAERMDNKKKITIEEQESALCRELTALGVDATKDLSIYDISSQYFRQKKIKDVLGTKDYRLKVRDLSKISPLQDLADRINISRLDLIDTENSRIKEIRREIKIEALKAAKAKADYLLSSIGERAGKSVYIKEVDESTPRNISGFYPNSNSTSSNTFVADGADTSRNDVSLSFAPEKVRFVILAKFEIE